MPNDDQPLLLSRVAGIREGYRQRIIEDGSRLVKGDSVLGQIYFGLSIIPVKLHTFIITRPSAKSSERVPTSAAQKTNLGSLGTLSPLKRGDGSLQADDAAAQLGGFDVEREGPGGVPQVLPRFTVPGVNHMSLAVPQGGRHGEHETVAAIAFARVPEVLHESIGEDRPQRTGPIKQVHPQASRRAGGVPGPAVNHLGVDIAQVAIVLGRLRPRGRRLCQKE